MLPAALPIPEPVTAEIWEELPEDEGYRLEVVDGLIQVSPERTVDHQRVAGRLAFLLAQHCPPDLVVLPGAEVRIADDPLHVRVPDVLVVDADAHGHYLTPAQVAVAVEVIYPSSVTTDRVHKRADYAEAGIPNYWILDVRGHPDIQLEAGVLFEDRYVSIVGTTERPMHIDQPFPFDFDLAWLVR